MLEILFPQFELTRLVFSIYERTPDCPRHTSCCDSPATPATAVGLQMGFYSSEPARDVWHVVLRHWILGAAISVAESKIFADGEEGLVCSGHALHFSLDWNCRRRLLVEL